jgi:hypothetical protein
VANGVRKNFSVLGVSRPEALRQIARERFSIALVAQAFHEKKLPTDGELRWATFWQYAIREAGEKLGPNADTDSLLKKAEQCYDVLQQAYKAGWLKWFRDVVKPIGLQSLKRSPSGRRQRQDI